MNWAQRRALISPDTLLGLDLDEVLGERVWDDEPHAPADGALVSWSRQRPHDR